MYNLFILNSITDPGCLWHQKCGISWEPLRRYYLELGCMVLKKIFFKFNQNSRRKNPCLGETWRICEKPKDTEMKFSLQFHFHIYAPMVLFDIRMRLVLLQSPVHTKWIRPSYVFALSGFAPITKTSIIGDSFDH